MSSSDGSVSHFSGSDAGSTNQVASPDSLSEPEVELEEEFEPVNSSIHALAAQVERSSRQVRVAEEARRAAEEAARAAEATARAAEETARAVEETARAAEETARFSRIRQARSQRDAEAMGVGVKHIADLRLDLQHQGGKVEVLIGSVAVGGTAVDNGIGRCAALGAGEAGVVGTVAFGLALPACTASGRPTGFGWLPGGRQSFLVLSKYKAPWTKPPRR
ncbi:PREDICTED: protein anoxia up-regulated-like [Nelumbo nucifera]|uniref:Protein anoxia up-regulated-like n=1 Tax=Nelumbo nucifera TaxID=4432 RepID=A0A1U8AEP6_NELNU|nr:PREDICTED: protein anoxia up-regulated-like [Nelumbo nucifera]